MGNTQSASTLTRTTGALDSFVAELASDIVYEKRYVIEISSWNTVLIILV